MLFKSPQFKSNSILPHVTNIYKGYFVLCKKCKSFDVLEDSCFSLKLLISYLGS